MQETKFSETFPAEESCVIYSGPNDLLERVERDGFFVLKNFFDPSVVTVARKEVETLLEQQEQKHLALKQADPQGRAWKTDTSSVYKSMYEDNLHTQFFFSTKSPAYCKLLNDLFASGVIKDLIKGLAGSMRLRVDLCQRAKGYDDSSGEEFQGPLPWHRDTPGEFTFGIFLDDNPQPGWGGTTFIKGSHRNPLNPRWDMLAGEKDNFTKLKDYTDPEKRFFPNSLLRLAILNRLARKKLKTEVVEATGMMGDIYFFLNDTWHGRAANITGKRNMASRFGGFASDFAFKNDIPLPDTIKDLPEPLRSLYLGPWEVNEDKTTFINRMMKERAKKTAHWPVTYLAAQEKKLLVQIHRKANLKRVYNAYRRKIKGIGN